MLLARILSRTPLGAAAFCALVPFQISTGRSTRGPIERAPLAGGAVPLEGPGVVLSQRKISSETGGFLDTLDASDQFGASVAALGDLDGDGIGDIAVGAPGDEAGAISDESNLQLGAVWVLFLAADGSTRAFTRIHAPSGAEYSRFASSVAVLGDLDGDGTTELAVGAPRDGTLDNRPGALWILFLRPDGTAKAYQKIGAGVGGFGGALDADDIFGSSLAAPGDLDGDGRSELVVGAWGDDDGGTGPTSNRGAIWVLFLGSDGTVRSQQKISATAGGFAAPLDRDDALGSSLAALGDLDGDGVPELAAGMPAESDGGFFRGAVWVLFLASDGTVRAQQKISATQGGFDVVLPLGTFFGAAVSALGDLDGDGVTELAVGAPEDSEAGARSGAAYVLFLNANGTVRAHQKLSALAGGFGGPHSDTHLGNALASPGDLDGDGVRELFLGAQQDSDTASYSYTGALWLAFLRADGTVRAERKIGASSPDFASTLDQQDEFGRALVALGDLDGDGYLDFAAGAPKDDDGAFDAGAVWILFSAANGSVRSAQKISLTQGGFHGIVDQHEIFGSAVAALGDLDQDGVPDLAVGAPTPNYSAEEWERGNVYVLFLNSDGTVKAEQRIGDGAGDFPGTLEVADFFGSALAPLGDLDGDGVLDLAVGAPGNDSPLWLLFLRTDGTVNAARRLDRSALGFYPGASSLAALGDLDRDGVGELALGALGYADSTVEVLFLENDGSVRAHTTIGRGQGGFTGTIADEDRFGSALAALGDLDGDDVPDLAVGAPYDRDGGGGPYQGPGAVWLLFLAPDGTVQSHRKVSATQGGFSGDLDLSDGFGSALAALGDRDGDGLVELGVGTPLDDDGGRQHGALWLLALDGIATIDFESDDDVARMALANGRAVATPDEFGRVLALASAGANLGPAVFDSTPQGPNDPGAAPDLLVDRGNVLVLQDSQAPEQAVPGVFDHPSDDPDGGTLFFAFPRPIAPRSLELADIDSGRRQSAKITLLDVAGRTRIYAVPAGWTEDLVLQGPPGFRTLDLTTLAPQPGFRSSASASESPGFDPDRVTRLTIGLGGSGALDTLRWDPYPPRLPTRTR